MSVYFDESSHNIQDEFKKSFKYYKSKKNIPDFNKIYSYHNMNTSLDSCDQIITTKTLPLHLEKWRMKLLIKPTTKWEAYHVLNHPGLIIISNGLTELGSMFWVEKCVQQYSASPFKTNLPKGVQMSEEESWWPQVKNCLLSDKKSDLINRLRWSTLGYHHDWDTKVYSEDEKSTMPEEMKMLCKVFLAGVGLPQCEDFDAEAAIVNYYPLGSTLSGHTDHSEPDKEAPLLSFSFGRSAIFLIGGEDKSTIPTPLFLHHGDVLIMSGSSRQCYHAVPRILSSQEMDSKNISNSFQLFRAFWEDLAAALHDCFEKGASSIGGLLNAAERPLDPYSFDKYSKVFDWREDFLEQSNIIRAHSSVLVLGHEDIRAILKYISSVRINMNVRQVNMKQTVNEELASV